MPLWLLSTLSGARKLALKAWYWFTDNPWRLSILLVAFLAFRLWSVDGDRDDWRDKARAMIAAAKSLEEADKAADAEALDVAAETKGTIDATNKQAKEDADRSDDPLDAISKRLRAESDSRRGQATR